MTKKMALQRNKIALLLAVMLIFGAFGSDAIRACDMMNRTNNASDIAVLLYPGAGEFFTDSLPLKECQSVREVSADWQSVAVVRAGRLVGAKGGPREQGILQLLMDGLIGITASGDSPGEKIRRQPRCFSKVIVCYIHNKDGAKG